jgi:DNA primase
MPSIDFREVRRRVPISRVLELVGFAPSERWGEQLRGPCPLHGSHSTRSRSFSVHLGKGVFRCFVCQAQGNALDLWAAWSNQGLHQAALALSERLHFEVPWLGHNSQANQRN